MNNYLETSTALLREAFDTRGNNLAALVEEISDALPSDLAKELLELDKLAGNFPESAINDSGLANFAYRCGRAQERIAALTHGYQFERLGFVRTETLTCEDTRNIDLDAVARIADLRDRVLKYITRLTLRFLAVSMILLAIALGFGLL